jgi:hypothetical protein
MYAADQLHIPADRLKPLFKAAWQLHGHLPRLAGLAKESGRDPEPDGKQSPGGKAPEDS